MMPNRMATQRVGHAALLALLPAAMLISGCFHAGPSVKQSLTSTANGDLRADAPTSGDPAEDKPPAFDFDKPAVESHLAAFQTHRRPFIDRAMGRGAKYLSFITDVLEREGLPTELAYLPIIESGYRTEAVSPAGAVGPWQFIPATGRRYGLRIDALVDERRDPIKSTEAAAQYLKDLHGMFGDWELSLAAYNSGEFRVARILASTDADDFWSMRERGYLPSETRQYVPSFLAAARIASAPEDYGFVARENDPPPEFETVDVERQVSLRAAADLCGVDPGDLAELNPALRRGITPSGYSLRVPTGKAEPLRVALATYVEPARPRRMVAKGKTAGRSGRKIASTRSKSTRTARSADRKPKRVGRAKRASAKTTQVSAAGGKGGRSGSYRNRGGKARSAVAKAPAKKRGSGARSAKASTKRKSQKTASKSKKVGRRGG